jgi:hypothetical protein
MALGGGTYVTQNKVLPGAYFQFISRATASAELSDRGVAAMALELDWGAEDEIITVEASDFKKNSLKIFGYDYASEKLKDIRELFLHATTLHAYKLTSGGTKASCTYAKALYGGTRGNDLKVIIQTDVDDESKFIVSLYLGTTKVDEQTVSKASELVTNDYVTWVSDAELAVTAGVSLTGGTNGTSDTSAHQTFLDKIESYPDVNAIGYIGTEDAVKSLYVAFAKRMRDEVGIKLQAVVHGYAGDSIACVNVKNQADIVPWVTGVVAGTAVNKSATNLKYDGECDVNTVYTQKQLESAIESGEFTLHQVGTEVHVLEDINSMVTTTDDQGEIFKDNQTVRVIDNIATSIASVFASKYLGKVPNNASGRTSLWSDIVKIHQDLNDIQAIEDFESGDITVEQGDTKKSVLVNSAITVVNTMTKLYMKTIIS